MGLGAWSPGKGPASLYLQTPVHSWCLIRTAVSHYLDCPGHGMFPAPAGELKELAARRTEEADGLLSQCGQTGRASPCKVGPLDARTHREKGEKGEMAKGGKQEACTGGPKMLARVGGVLGSGETSAHCRPSQESLRQDFGVGGGGGRGKWDSKGLPGKLAGALQRLPLQETGRKAEEAVCRRRRLALSFWAPFPLPAQASSQLALRALAAWDGQGLGAGIPRRNPGSRRVVTSSCRGCSGSPPSPVLENWGLGEAAQGRGGGLRSSDEKGWQEPGEGVCPCWGVEPPQGWKAALQEP